jgi:hypothetical protein
LGVATGGAALLGTRMIGGHYRNVANDDELKRKAVGGEGISDKEQRSAQRRLALANSASKWSFDARQTKLGKVAEKKSGMDFQTSSSFVGLGSDKFKGGRQAQAQRTEAKEQAKLKTYELSKAAAREQDERAKDAKENPNSRQNQYEKDKNEAKKNTESTKTPKQEQYEKDMEVEVEKARQANAGHMFTRENEEKVRQDYAKNNKPPEAPVFDEKEFKKAYIKGGNMSGYNLDKTVEGGDVKVRDAKEENLERRRAYTSSLADKATVNEQRVAFKTFWHDFLEDSKRMYKDPLTLGGTAALGIATGGLGFAAPAAVSFVSNLKKAFSVKNTDREVIAGLGQGVDPNKKLAEDLKKMFKEGGSGKQAEEILKKHTEGESKDEEKTGGH